MQNNYRNWCSLAAIALFALVAVSSIGPDASTNTSVEIKDCEEMPPVSVDLKINVHVRNPADVINPNGEPNGGVAGKLYIVHQKVNSNDDCTYVTDYTKTIDFVSDTSGNFAYTGPTWTHDNAQDVIRVEMVIPFNLFENSSEVRETIANTYSLGTFSFTAVTFEYLN